MKIFIAGPMTTSGEPGYNMHQACHAAVELVNAGFSVYIPHILWIADSIRPCDPAKWKRQNLEWLAASDAILRLPGVSEGADKEVEAAEKIGMPIFRNTSRLIRSLGTPPV